MKPMEDAPLFLGIPRVDDSRAATVIAPLPQDTIVHVEPTQLLRELRSAPSPTLAIRMSDLRGRPTPLRLAELRADESVDPCHQPAAA